jgi:pimeloyl-ACP methyl ester carboxylesterase
MDLLRRAVGDPILNYLGISYGTYLGATYASLFPSRGRAMVLDGSADPVQWATGTGGSAAVLSTLLRLRGQACAQWPVLAQDRYTGPFNRPHRGPDPGRGQHGRPGHALPGRGRHVPGPG